MSLTDEQITKLWYEIIHNHDSNQFNTFAYAIYKLGRESMRDEVIANWQSNSDLEEFATFILELKP